MHAASTAVLEQEAEEAARCAGPGECDCPSCRLSAATGLGPYRAPEYGARPQPYGVIVDDDHDLADGQIHKNDFLDQTSAAIEQAVDDVLRPMGQTARDCPYLAYWLNFYRNASAARIERVIQKYAAPTQIDPDGLRTAVVERVTVSARRYVETQGADMALPSGIDASTTSDGVGEPAPEPQAVQAKECDTICTKRPAYNCGEGIGVPLPDPCPGGSKAMMTFCPGFINSTDVNYRAYLSLHEGSHGTAGLRTKDLAYSYQREIITLTQAQALTNTDSYVLLILNLHSPGSAKIGPATPDKVAGVDCPGADPVLCRAFFTSIRKP